MKKILYIYHLPDGIKNGSGGVFNKLKAQILSSQNTKFDFLVLTSDNIELKYNNVYIERIKNDALYKLSKLPRLILDYAKNYEYVLIRKITLFPNFVHTLHKLDYYGTKVSLDFQTKEIPEFISQKKYFRTLVESSGIILMKYFNLPDSIVGVTNEITEYQKRIYNKRGLTIGNGILFDESLITGYSKFDGKKLKLVMSLGSWYPWHGVERLLKSIEKCKNYIDIHLSLLVGSKNSYIESLKNKNVTIYYNLPENEMKEIYANSNLAVGSLGLYVKKLNEATPLKSREYLQRGIPFIYGYIDPDLDEEINRYLFKVDNDDSIIDFKKVIKYLEELDPCTSEFLVNFAKNKLSWDKKLKKIENFLEYKDNF